MATSPDNEAIFHAADGRWVPPARHRPGARSAHARYPADESLMCLL